MMIMVIIIIIIMVIKNVIVVSAELVADMKMGTVTCARNGCRRAKIFNFGLVVFCCSVYLFLVDLICLSFC